MSRPRTVRRAVTVPNGRTVTGKFVGLSAVTLTEHALRDELAATVDGATEAWLGYGRADVLTAQTVFEVEHATKWRTAVRQALQYAAQTGCAPAVALFDEDMPPGDVLPLYVRLRDGKPPVGFWWHCAGKWRRIGSCSEARSAGTLIRAEITEQRRELRRQAAHEGDVEYWQAAEAADRLQRRLKRAYSDMESAVVPGGQLELPWTVTA